VNTSTAQLSFVTRIGVGTQLTALSIDSQGRYYIAAYDGSANTSSIYSVNPGTGTALWLTTALVSSNSYPNLVVDFEQQPGAGRWLAVTEQRSGSGYGTDESVIAGCIPYATTSTRLSRGWAGQLPCGDSIERQCLAKLRPGGAKRCMFALALPNRASPSRPPAQRASSAAGEQAQVRVIRESRREPVTPPDRFTAAPRPF
jgi:hypothetical protein